jgi:glyoxylase-like metal-dependent hydrolase (beta-lactamase superfamily II)
MHHTTLGDFELTVVSDGGYISDGGAFFGVVPKVMWQRKVVPDANNCITVGLNSLLVRTGHHTVLIETGIGNKLSERMRKVYGQPAKLLDSLRQTGTQLEEIDTVINTHLHFDHCGWNTVRQGDRFVATFPRARYFVQEGEWQHARQQHERDAVSYISENYNPLLQNGQMHLLHGDQEIVPGIFVKLFPGHTANMQAVIIKSGGKVACYISDLIPTTWHLHPTWVMAFDLFPLQTIESRKAYYSQAVTERWLTVFTHDPEFPWGYIEKDAMGRMIAKPLPAPAGGFGNK